MQSSTGDTMRLTFSDGAAAGHSLDVPRRPTGPSRWLWIAVEDSAARIVPEGLVAGAVLYGRDLATAQGASYRSAHPEDEVEGGEREVDDAERWQKHDRWQRP